MTQPSASGTILRLADAETITAREGRDVVILSASPGLTVTWSRYAPGERGPDLHVHREHTDAFYVLAGELTLGLGPAGDPVRVRAGGFVAAPPNLSHSFANEGPVEARFLNLHAPDAGFAAYMRAARDGVQAGFDSFDPPADGGLPAVHAVVSGPGEGEPLASGAGAGILKAALPDLRVAEWTLAGTELPDESSPPAACYVLEGELEAGAARILTVQPGAAARGRA